MRKIAISLLLLAALTVRAQDCTTNPDRYYLAKQEIVNSLCLLPAPPEEGSARFAYDRERYEWGKSLRGTERGERAIADANLDAQWLDRCFSDAFGMKLTKENTPEIYKLLNNMKEDAGNLATCDAKLYYSRVRPFVRFKEPTSTPNDEVFLRVNGSYPSGHTAIGWASALVLSEINPKRATEIIKRGYDMGDSRVIVGAHYQSDVDAGRVMGASIIGLLHTKPEFQKQLAKAKAEFAKKSKTDK